MKNTSEKGRGLSFWYEEKDAKKELKRETKRGLRQFYAGNEGD